MASIRPLPLTNSSSEGSTCLTPNVGLQLTRRFEMQYPRSEMCRFDRM